MAATARLLPDGKRLHLNHGPIDLIIAADGKPDDVRLAYAAAKKRFAKVLEDLVEELPILRSDVPEAGRTLSGSIARAMERAARPHWARHLTPMAAVAGAVADAMLAAMLAEAHLDRASVNNGGDIAIHLAPGEHFTIASPSGPITVRGGDGVGGVATSGWRGRSFSLGIADSVTVLARSAAEADVAATLTANAVDLPHSSKVKRQAACDLAPDSDLRDRLVTIGVLPLSETEAAMALDSGAALAARFIGDGHIRAASLSLAGQTRHLEAPAHA